jgi:hypothetical protein
MKSLEEMGLHRVLDETIAGVYNTVATIKESCRGTSMIDSGLRNAEIVLGVLQDRYHPPPTLTPTLPIATQLPPILTQGGVLQVQ